MLPATTELLFRIRRIRNNYFRKTTKRLRKNLNVNFLKITSDSGKQDPSISLGATQDGYGREKLIFMKAITPNGGQVRAASRGSESDSLMTSFIISKDFITGAAFMHKIAMHIHRPNCSLITPIEVICVRLVKIKYLLLFYVPSNFAKAEHGLCLMALRKNGMNFLSEAHANSETSILTEIFH